MLENPVITLEDSTLKSTSAVTAACSKHARILLTNGVHANPSMSRSDSPRITIPGGKRRVESANTNSTVAVQPKTSDNVPYDPAGQHTATKRRSMYIPHKQPNDVDVKPHMPPPSSFNPNLVAQKSNIPLSITRMPVSIPTYRSCITCLTSISVFDAGEICTSCRLSLSAPSLPAPQSWPSPNSPTKDGMSAFIDSQDGTKRRRKSSSSEIQLTHPAEFEISPPQQSISAPAIPTKRRKLSHNLDDDEPSRQSMNSTTSTYPGHVATSTIKAVALTSRLNEGPTLVGEKSEGSGILKVGRGRSSVGAKKVSWADISGDGSLEIGPSQSISSVKIEESSSPIESTLGVEPRRLTIKIKPLKHLSYNIPSEADDIEGWDSDLTELSESDGDSSGSDLPMESLKTQSPQSITGFKIRLPPRPRKLRRCASSRCNAELASDYRWKSCVLCRSRNREYQRKRQNLQGRHWRLEDELSDAQTGPSTAEAETTAVEGARLCLMRRCTFIIPTMDEYASKFCSLCRLFRKSKKALGMNLASNSRDGVNGVRLVFTAALHDLPWKRKPDVGRCFHADCGMFLSSTDSKLCVQCHHRNRFIIRWVSDALKSQLSEGSTLQCERLCPPDVPEYLSMKLLLADLRSRARAFLRGQALFFLFNEPASPDLIKAGFVFEGEYTTVNPDLDLSSQKDDIYVKVLGMKKAIEQEINIQFGSEEGRQCAENGFHVNFPCSLKVPVLRAMKTDDAVEIKSGTKEMKGELVISLLKDNSHPFIPGEKIIIRFRMIG